MLGVWIASGVIGGLLLITFVYGLAIRSMYREKLRTDEVYLVSTQDEWKLRVCRYRRGRTLGEPVLLCHGAGANHHNFSFPGNDSLIDFLVAKGYDCWAVDLRGCRSSQPPDGKKRFDAKLDDYLLQDLPAVIEHIRRVTGYHTMHWIGHSLGGLLLYAYAREFGVRGLAGCVTLGAPIGFDGTHVAAPDFLVRFFARHPRFVTALAHAYVPIGRTLHLPLGFFPISLRNLHPNITTEHLFLMLDNLLPDVFVTLADWARGKKCVMKGGALDVKAGLAALRAPLLVFLAPRDPFVSLEYGWRFFDALPTRDKQMIV
ncbi:MAG TPA: alpha/beta fold hydrolase, partial [Candidatus Hydrogenedentes bacterium]|nr:alpha/beta fold hydrolase [Candidatus Hydrogenedentota bacterium]